LSLAVTRARVLETYPHDPEAFTQGLLWLDGRLYESTGLVGRSGLREVELGTGRLIRSAPLPVGLFGEGLTAWGGEILSLTWRDNVGLRWDAATLACLGRFDYPAEAWGLTGDGESLIVSDGTPVLHFLDPATMAERRRLIVCVGERPLGGLNELQWVHGEILANVFTWPLIARIDPARGRVTGWIDLTALVAEAGSGDPEKVANGIAWDEAGEGLFVTGKNWPSLYRIALP
jgi:glutamine cyclotransferase